MSEPEYFHNCRTKCHQVFHTRWLSFEGAVDAIVASLDPSFTVLLWKAQLVILQGNSDLWQMSNDLPACRCLFCLSQTTKDVKLTHGRHG